MPYYKEGDPDSQGLAQSPPALAHVLMPGHISPTPLSPKGSLTPSLY